MKVSFTWPWKIRLVNSVMLKTALKHHVVLSWGHHEALWDVIPTRSPKPEKEASILKVHLKNGVTEQMQKTLKPTTYVQE